MRRAVVSGAVAMRPHRGGHAWVFLNWLVGLRSLGFDVVFVDRMERPQRSHIRWLHETMSAVGLGCRWGLTTESRCYGVSGPELQAWFEDCDVCIDVMGHADPRLLKLARIAVFLDIDPGFPQLWQHLGQATVFGRHHAYATVGLGMRAGACRIPTLGIDWIPTPPPVALGEWPLGGPSTDAFTSVATWRGPFAPITVDGDVLGLRVHQFRQFLDVPANVSAPIEMALDIDPTDAVDREQLVRAGYRLTCPRGVAGSTTGFRSYVQQSAGELCVAKDLYVRSRAGWFSDRSACYLASGRAVIHHDTGLRPHLPVGDGLLLFDDSASAASAIREVMAAPDHHAGAARQLAEQHLDARIVIGALLDRVGVS